MNQNISIKHLSWLLLATFWCLSDLCVAGAINDHFPRICNLNIGGPAYYDKPEVIARLAKADLTLLGFYRTWEADHKPHKGAMRATVQKIKALNPAILIGQYTVLNEAPDASNPTPDSDKSQKIDAMDWWIRGAFGEKLQWTQLYGKYDVNFTQFAPADAEGKRYPEWLAQRDYQTYFAKVPEFDIWYLDNVFAKPRVPLANWKRDQGLSLQSADNVQNAFRAGHVKEWRAIRSLKPDILLLGNVDKTAYATPEYSGQLNGALLEALMGLRWSVESRQGWAAMMQTYHEAFNHLRPPKLVIFNVHGAANDYRQMRFGLASSLLNDGYFSYSVKDDNYKAVAWFDEFDINLGRPVQGPQASAWQNGVYRREFEKGVVFVNPGNSPVSVSNNQNLVRITGKQAPQINNGQVLGASFSVPARDGIIALKIP